MALTWPETQLRVVGFVGQAAAGAAAMRSPVFETTTERYFAGDPDADAPPRFDCSRTEIAGYHEEGLVTLTDASWNRVATGVVLYGHSGFFERSPDGLVLSPSPLVWDDKAGVHLAYLPRDQALGVLAGWGNILIADARKHLRGRPTNKDLERAFDSARRARFTAPPPEHRELRIDMFVVLATAYQALGRTVERIYRDALLDFDDATVDHIRRRVDLQLAGLGKPYAPFRTRARPPRGHSPAAPRPPSLLPDPADTSTLRIITRHDGQRAA